MPTELDDLDHDSTLVAKLAWGEVPAGVVGDAAEALGAVRNRVDAALLAAVRSFEARGEHRAERYTSVTPWIQHHLRLPKRQARRVARLCRFVERFGRFEAALAAGEISLDHLDVLATAHKQRFHDAWAEAEELLVDSARQDRFEDYARHVASFADQLDPAEADERFHDQLEDRALTKATSIWGQGHLEAWMDPFSFAIVSDEIDRLERELFEEDWARARDRLGHDPTILDLARTPANRRHDALVRMAERSKAFAGGAVASAFSVTVHTDTATLEAALARHLGLDDTHLPRARRRAVRAGRRHPDLARRRPVRHPRRARPPHRLRRRRRDRQLRPQPPVRLPRPGRGRAGQVPALHRPRRLRPHPHPHRPRRRVAGRWTDRRHQPPAPR